MDCGREGTLAPSPDATQIGSRLVDRIHETAPHLATLLGDWSAGDGPLYRQLATALRRAIEAGAIPAGTVLPPERQLARVLSLSRSTVVSAYERLKTDGWLMSRQGSGTWVADRDAGPDADAVVASRLFQPIPEDAPPAAGEDLIELTIAAAPGSAAVAETIAALDPADVAALTATHGYLPPGLRELRAAVADRFSRSGVPTTEEQVLVTTGAHQAISLIARHVLQPGETVLVESPTFPGALDALRGTGARLVPIPVDDDGPRVDAIADLATRTSPRLIHVTPTFHNPTGAVMAAERRRALVDLARELRVPVVDDLALVDISLDDVAVPPPLAALDPEAPILSVGSVSKLFWCGLRVGWIRASEAVVARLQRTKTVADLGSPLLDQLVATRLLDRVEDARAERAAALRPRRDALEALLEEHLPAWRWRRPRGGFSLWVELPHGSGDEFADVAARHGVAIVPGSSLSADETHRRFVRLVYIADTDTLERGVARLAAAWDAYAPATSRPSTRLVI